MFGGPSVLGSKHAKETLGLHIRNERPIVFLARPRCPSYPLVASFSAALSSPHRRMTTPMLTQAQPQI